MQQQEEGGYTSGARIYMSTYCGGGACNKNLPLLLGMGRQDSANQGIFNIVLKLIVKFIILSRFWCDSVELFSLPGAIESATCVCDLVNNDYHNHQLLSDYTSWSGA